MTLTDGYHEVPAGRLAAVVTCLEMTEAPESPRLKTSQRGGIRLVDKPDLTWYRDLFRSVGRDWLWWSRLALSDQNLADIIRDPRVEVHVLEEEGAARGLLELDGRAWPEVELSFFGVVPERVGSGAGAALMAFALDRVWSRGAKRFWLHTCSLDHPRALGFYGKWGFRPYARRIEIAPDPRLTGVLPREAAPQIPLIVP